MTSGKGSKAQPPSNVSALRVQARNGAPAALIESRRRGPLGGTSDPEWTIFVFLRPGCPSRLCTSAMKAMASLSPPGGATIHHPMADRQPKRCARPALHKILPYAVRIATAYPHLTAPHRLPQHHAPSPLQAAPGPPLDPAARHKGPVPQWHPPTWHIRGGSTLQCP